MKTKHFLVFAALNFIQILGGVIGLFILGPSLTLLKDNWLYALLGFIMILQCVDFFAFVWLRMFIFEDDKENITDDNV
jgi:hypothetical protein